MIAFALVAAEACGSGAAAAQSRDLEKARVLLEQCVQTSGATLESFLLLAGVHQARRDDAALYATARAAIRRFPEEKRFYLAAATQAGRRKEFAEGVRILEQALKRWPTDAAVQKLLASALYGRGVELLEAGDNQAAADQLRRATALSADDVDAHMNLGRALHNTGRYTEALAAFERVRSLNAGYPLLAFHLGMSLYYMGEFDKAVETLAEVEDHPPAHLVRGLALLSRGSFTDAASELQAATAAMPNDSAAHYGYARALVRLGRLADAEPHLRKTMELDTVDPAPVNLLVAVLRKLDRADEADKIAAIATERMKRQRTARTGDIKFKGPDR